jgi:hypothetical protein
MDNPADRLEAPAAVPEMLPIDHPNLQLARRRLQRTQWLWALLFGAMAWLSFGLLRAEHPLAFVAWAAGAVLLVIEPQPLLLALVALMWALSLTSLVPSVATLTGPDPLGLLFDTGSLETLVLIFIRLVIVVTAMNQFLLYRMLYGTRKTAGLSEDMPDIPEVVPNRADGYALAAALLGMLSILGGVGGIPLAARGYGGQALGISIDAAVFAIGFGVGSAFSPTSRRSASLLGVGLGTAGYLLAIAIGGMI